ncbi:MAG: phosphate transporter [Verrucomicrobiales bacterium]|nr:phosphate transporter [Verrucomicrobiales bacterium]
MMVTFLFIAVCFLAYSNGANDNFKAVASLFGSKTASYRASIGWATIANGAGSIAAIFFAEALLKRFSGKGLVPDSLTAQPEFLLAVALGTGVTVILATLLGFPVSTTHGLVGGLVGAGLITGPQAVNFSALGKNFIFPLIFSPVIAVAAGALVYSLMRIVRLSRGIDKELCVCVGTETQVIPVARPGGIFAAEMLPHISVTADKLSVCRQRYVGNFLGFNACKLVDGLHFLSAGGVGFARGLNDTPKIAALLLVAKGIRIEFSLLAVAIAMGIGGLLNAKKVADTMANKITEMTPGQGLAANLATSFLVTTASYHGLPVSTTHVSVGSLFGIGMATRQAHYRTMRNIALSWVITLPCAATLSAVIYWILVKV